MQALRRLTTPTELEQAARLLERAFYDDPLMLYILPDPAERAKRVGWYYDANVKHAALFGEVWATPELDGVAIWLSPSRSSPWSYDKLKQSGLIEMPERLGNDAAERFMQSMNFDMPHDDKISWYLLLIGVEPDKRRHGIGSQLLVPMLSRADAEKMPITLETNDGRNVSFYLKNGFEQTFEGHVPNGPGLWAFRRGPM
jgi:GNAT superfamily N-acetyltransferase